VDTNARTWAMLLHFSVFAGYIVPIAGLIAPVVIWQIKKNEYPELDEHGKAVVNFIISLVIYSLISAVLVIVLIGVPLLLALAAIGIIFPIIGGIKANNGELWRYPLTLNIIK
jgi:uncharacterized protein